MNFPDLTFSARTTVLSCLVGLSATVAQAAVLWDNGPLITHTGGMANGADRSAISPTGGSFGFTTQPTSLNRVADDFTVSGASWSLSSARFFTYQTGSATTSTITGITLRVWDAVPGTGSVVWGNTTTNVMSGTGFTGIYRTTATNNTDVNRPIMYVDVALPSLVLAPGTYWLDFAFTGTLASGPWAPPVSSATQFVVGNAVLSSNSGPYVGLLDSLNNQRVALPFVLEGTIIPEPSSAAAILGVGVITLAASRRRRRASAIAQS